MTETLDVACVQLSNRRDTADNIDAVVAAIRAAAVAADLIALPENADRMEPDLERLRAGAEDEATHRALAAYRATAAEVGRWLLIGSLGVRRDDGAHVNRGYLIGPDGAARAIYDKIHMFDVDLPNGETYRESDRCAPGDRAVLADTPWGGLGMTICYDLRFPHLYRTLAQRGARLLAVPAAFTRRTGEAHWHVLLRARAIENGCFVIAPGQCGTHAENRRTYGHSLIVDPWGEVLADGGPGPGIITARLDLSRVEDARRMIPSLRHDRPIG